MLSNAIRQTSEYQRVLARLNAGTHTGAVALFGLPPSARAQVLAALCEDTGRPAVVLCAGEADATRFAQDCAAFGRRAEVFAARDFVLRAVEGQNHEYEYRRLSVLGSMAAQRTEIVCAGIEAALAYTIPPQELRKSTLQLAQNDEISVEALTCRLAAAGYQRRHQVEGPGQFSVRGGIVDIFAPDMQRPCRLEFWGDVIDTMHTFDVVSQRREDVLEHISLTPAREVLLGDAAQAAQLLREAANRSECKAAMLRVMEADLKQLDAGVMPTAMDKYLALRYAKPATVMDYFEAPILLFSEPGAVREAARALEYRFFEMLKGLLENNVLCAGLEGLYEPTAALWHRAERQAAVLCESFTRTIHEVRLCETVNLPAHSIPPWPGEVSSLLEELRPLLERRYAVAVLAGTARAADALARDLTLAGVQARACAEYAAQPVAGQVVVVPGHLHAGTEYPQARFAVMTGRRHKQAAARPRSKKKNTGLSGLSDISPGDYVVHQNHGIGVYVGIERLDLQGVVKDYLKINYEKGDTLYVPVTQLDVLSRYTAPGESERVRLSRLGGDAWSKTKARVRTAAQEMARELIALYAKRQQAPGFAFPADNEWQRDFETRFEYDETDDQLTSAAEIKADMQQAHPMDRLLCGDVGVGKTEVALRAAFKCLMGGKQCAVLVPTTILAWQHFQTAAARMEAFPVKVRLLSRFTTPAQQRETLRGLADGTVDLVVGTHKLLQKNVQFHDLGLVIIDEEQRFGVKHKERLKEAFIGVDMLTLSATPIPRTLSMAMSGLRDMSTIEEPPFERRPVETYVLEQDWGILTEALRRELDRGGQAYYIHNRIETLDTTAMHLAQRLPEARIAAAHGRMDEQTLSRVWQQLLDGEIDILVCTTLIETGVDVRNCNTLIIEDADRMGLAQLYQLRGRVGRSGRKAYAYFTFRRDKVLTDIAAKRLSAIREFTSFGSGFRIAMRDLQIRGAGNLLGQSQHGHMEAVGYEAYVKMLNQAIAQERGETPETDKSDCLIDITVDAYIPEAYIPDPSGRIEAYKKIAAINSEDDASDVLDELIDRYGDVPPSVEGLVEISRVRMTAAALGIYEITQRGSTLLLYSDRFTAALLKPLMQQMGQRLLVNASGKPYLAVKLYAGEKAVHMMKQVLERMRQARAEQEQSGTAQQS